MDFEQKFRNLLATNPALHDLTPVERAVLLKFMQGLEEEIKNSKQAEIDKAYS